MKDKMREWHRKVICVVCALVIALGTLPAVEPAYGWSVWKTDLLDFEERIQSLIDSGEEYYTFDVHVLRAYAMLPRPRGIFVEKDATIRFDTWIYGDMAKIQSIRSYRSSRHMEFIVAEGCTLTLIFDDIKLEGDGGGGGIKVTGGGDLVLENAWIANCNTFPSGGAVMNEEGNVYIKNSKFTSNKAISGSGGAVSAHKARLENCVFEENISDADGGAVKVSAGGLTVTDCKFIKNSAEGNGGAIAIDNCDGVISNSVFQGNLARGKGSGIYVDASGRNLDLVDCDMGSDADTMLYITGELSQIKDGAVACTVTFENSNGSEPFRQNVLEGAQIAEPELPVREGYRFTGWYTDSELNNLYQFDSLVSSNFTLYAGWKAAETATACEHPAYIKGYQEGAFRPEGTLTRAEAAVMFSSLASASLVAEAVNVEFSDISGQAWYYEAITQLVRQGAVSGYADGTFRPEEPVTRAEFTAMARFFTERRGGGETPRFSDLSSQHWAAGAIAEIASGGYLSGYPNGIFGPEQNITRAEAVSVINRIKGCEGINKGAVFTDVPQTHWAFEAVSAAATDHDH